MILAKDGKHTIHFSHLDKARQPREDEGAGPDMTDNPDPILYGNFAEAPRLAHAGLRRPA